VLFEGYDGCHLVVCMVVSFVEAEYWIVWNSSVGSGDISQV
jgi:hypothetical protein